MLNCWPVEDRSSFFLSLVKQCLSGLRHIIFFMNDLSPNTYVYTLVYLSKHNIKVNTFCSTGAYLVIKHYKLLYGVLAVFSMTGVSVLITL
jgi:hypothetical protein